MFACLAGNFYDDPLPQIVGVAGRVAAARCMVICDSYEEHWDLVGAAQGAPFECFFRQSFFYIIDK